jgi:hypothetical protein
MGVCYLCDCAQMNIYIYIYIRMSVQFIGFCRFACEGSGSGGVKIPVNSFNLIFEGALCSSSWTYNIILLYQFKLHPLNLHFFVNG